MHICTSLIYIPDLSRFSIVSNDDVDGKVGVDSTHLVLPASTETLDHVCDSSFGGTQLSDVLAATVPDGKLDLVTLGRLDNTHFHVHVLEVLNGKTE